MHLTLRSHVSMTSVIHSDYESRWPGKVQREGGRKTMFDVGDAIATALVSRIGAISRLQMVCERLSSLLLQMEDYQIQCSRHICIHEESRMCR